MNYGTITGKYAGAGKVYDHERECDPLRQHLTVADTELH